MCAILFIVATTIMVILGGDFGNSTPTPNEKPAAEGQEAEGEEAAYPGPYEPR